MVLRAGFPRLRLISAVKRRVLGERSLMPGDSWTAGACLGGGVFHYCGFAKLRAMERGGSMEIRRVVIGRYDEVLGRFSKPEVSQCLICYAGLA